MGLWSFLFSYLLGGLTFIPLAVVTIVFFSRWYLPDDGTKDNLEEQPYSDERQPLIESDEVPSEEDSGVNVYTTAWVTVSREYFIYPSGGPKDVLNPPEQAANDASIGKSESAYSSLYKLMSNNGSKLLNRGGSASNESSMVDGEGKGSSSPARSSGASTPTKSLSKLNKYFAVLKHGNILLYSDAEEVKVKHVIVLANHIVMLWPPNVPDAELFIKRSAICLAKRDTHDGFNSLFNDPHSPPRDAFYLYLDICSEKEDFYHALIRASKRRNTAGWDPSLENGVDLDPSILAAPLNITTSQIMDLIVNLHASEANVHTRWFNALLGRLLLNLKDTQLLEDRIRNRIVYKLSRIKRPNFIGEIEVNKIHTGMAVPYFTNMKLKELTPEGLFVMEANVSYSGSFSVEIATKAIINLGSRFKPRDVSVVLAVTLKNLEGKLNIKIKPPPSNRIWYNFETMPKLNLLIEPVVSSKQITYSMVTKAIENRIRELFKEGLVSPNWDDIAFFNTKDMFYRGGIWNTKDRPESHKNDDLSLSKLQQDNPHPIAHKIHQSVSLPSELKKNTSTEIHETHALRHRNTLSDVSGENVKPDDLDNDSTADDNVSVLSFGEVQSLRPRSESRSTTETDLSSSKSRSDGHIGELKALATLLKLVNQLITATSMFKEPRIWLAQLKSGVLGISKRRL
jgi:hypothetical protein